MEYLDVTEEGFAAHDDSHELPQELMEVVEEMMPGTNMPIKPMVVEERGPTDWTNDGDHGKFIIYLKDRIGNIPPHTGSTTVGCERAISYLKRLDKEISRAIQSDEKNIINEEESEQLRELIHDYVAKLEERHGHLSDTRNSKHKKKASIKVGKEVVARIKDGIDIGYYVEVDNGSGPELLSVNIAEPTDEQVQKFARGETENLTKEAQTARIVLFEDPFLHAITRLLINSHVSAGRNIEDVYDKLKKKYAFTPREELSIQSLLVEKGMPIFKDFGRIDEPADPSDGKGVEFSTTYYA